jgi:hypothetical protein
MRGGEQNASEEKGKDAFGGSRDEGRGTEEEGRGSAAGDERGKRVVGSRERYGPGVCRCRLYAAIFDAIIAA